MPTEKQSQKAMDQPQGLYDKEGNRLPLATVKKRLRRKRSKPGNSAT